MTIVITHAAGTVPIVGACNECSRSFNLLDDTESDEFYYGHDCEA